MENRRERRWPRQLDVQYWAHGDDETAHRGVATNVSVSGLFVRARAVIPTGSRLRVEVRHSKHGFVCEGVVARVVKTPGHLQAVKPSGMGIRFLLPTELLAELLPEVMQQREASDQAGDRELGGERRSEEETSQAGTVTGSADEAEVAPARPLETVVDRRFELRYPDRGAFRQAFERDIVTGGLFVPIPDPPELRSVVLVDLIVGEDADSRVTIEARVVHRLDAAEGGGVAGDNILLGMGLEILDMSVVERLRALLP